MEIGNFSLQRPSTVVIDRCRLMDEKIALVGSGTYPLGLQSSCLLAGGVMTPWGCRELVSRAAWLMSLSPDYSIRRAFDFE